jgi:hypothetical protein
MLAGVPQERWNHARDTSDLKEALFLQRCLLNTVIPDQVERHSWLGDTALSHLRLYAVSSDMN